MTFMRLFWVKSMEASERRGLINRLAVLLGHLLKWQFQPLFRGKDWQLTIKEQRRQLGRLLDDNPSLKARLEEFVKEAYLDALLLAARETGIDETALPQECPYPCTSIIDANFFPQ